jgi:phospholipase C
MISGHGDCHPAIGRAMGPGIDPGIDSPSSILAGEAFLERVFNASGQRPQKPARMSGTRPF